MVTRRPAKVVAALLVPASSASRDVDDQSCSPNRRLSIVRD